MDCDRVFSSFNRHGVEYLLIGGLNFMLRHVPVLTYDIDIWIHDTAENRSRCEQALMDLDTEWGISDEEWGPVSSMRPGWLERQGMFSTMSPHGAIDIFRFVRGAGDWSECRARAVAEATANGTKYLGISDEDMLRCQMALEVTERSHDRISTLNKILEKRGHDKP